MVWDWSKVSVRVNSHVGWVRCEPGWRLSAEFRRTLTDCDLWYVWAGRGQMQLEESVIDLRPGVCLWTRPNRTYLAEQDLDDRLGVTFVHFDVLDENGQPIVDHARLPGEVYELSDVHQADVVGRRVAALMHNGEPAEMARRAAAHLLTGLLMDIVEGLTLPPVGEGGTPLHHHRAVMALVARMTESPHEIQTVEQMAQQAGYSQDHFSRVFRTVTGQSPQQFAISTRMNRACQLLAETDLTVNRIAELLGYRDAYFFSRQFRQKIGRTPRMYRSAPRIG